MAFHWPGASGAGCARRPSLATSHSHPIEFELTRFPIGSLEIKCWKSQVKEAEGERRVFFLVFLFLLLLLPPSSPPPSSSSSSNPTSRRVSYRPIGRTRGAEERARTGSALTFRGDGGAPSSGRLFTALLWRPVAAGASGVVP